MTPEYHAMVKPPSPLLFMLPTLRQGVKPCLPLK